MRRAAATIMTRSGRTAAVIAVISCAATLVLAYLNKARCAGPPFTAAGRSLDFDRFKDSAVCYSDIQFLWLGRGIDQHVFPYLDGGITAHGALFGGAVEYPVLSGVLMWIGAIGAHTDAEFLRHTALLLAPFALLTAWLLGRMAGRRALLWAAAPPLVLYAFHNWELPVVLTTVVAFAIVVRGEGKSLRVRGVLAAIALGVGFCLKLYPGVFVVPLALYVLTGGRGGRESAGGTARFDVRGALMVVCAMVLVVVTINLPFALAGYPGWRASFLFQQQRRPDITTNSIWYWGVRRLFGHYAIGESVFDNVVTVLSPTLVLASFALAVWLGWRRYRSVGTFPWIGVSGAMLCGFLLLHKVHSPQYTLWLVPFLVLLTVPWQAVVGYLAADIALGVGVFRYFHALAVGAPEAVANERVVEFGVWAGALLLGYFFFAFLRADVPADMPVAVRTGRSRARIAVGDGDRGRE